MPPLSSPAPHLPTETIETILDFLIDSFSSVQSPPPPPQPVKKGKRTKVVESEDVAPSTLKATLKSASLVAKSWRTPAQKRVFERLVIKGGKSGQRATDGANQSPFLAACTKSIKLDFGLEEEKKAPTAAEIKKNDFLADVQLLALLKSFPNLIEIEFYKPSFTTFRYFDPLELAFLSRLQKLAVHNANFDASSAFVHSLLPFTLNISSLSIVTSGHNWSKAFAEVNAPHLPNLREVAILDGGHYRAELLGLLPLSTWKQITHLESNSTLSHGRGRPCPFSDLTSLAGSSITSLHMTAHFSGSWSDALEPCVKVKKLTVDGDRHWPGLLRSLPTTVTQVDFRGKLADTCLEELRDLKKSGIVYSTEKKLSMAAVPTNKELEEMEAICEKVGIESFIHPPPLVIPEPTRPVRQGRR